MCLRGCWGSGPHLLSCILDTMTSDSKGKSDCFQRFLLLSNEGSGAAVPYRKVHRAVFGCAPRLMMCFAKLVGYLEALVCIKERNDGVYSKDREATHY